MKEGTEYIKKVKSFYSFLESDFGFCTKKETINGNVFYDVEYIDKEKVISISYENIEDHLEVIIFILQDRELPDYDDKTKTLHLNQMNKLVMSMVDDSKIKENAKYFSKYNSHGILERKLLKGAKELRLFLNNFEKLFKKDR
jgi:hypothetical protein